MIQTEELDNVPTDAARDFRDTSTALDTRIAMIEVEMDQAKDHAAHAGRQRPQTQPANKEERSDEGDRGYMPDLWVRRSPRSPRPEPSREPDKGKLQEWQDKGMTHLSSKMLEMARWLMWASLQKENTEFSTGSGLRLAKFLEALEFDRQRYDASKAGTEGAPYRIVRRVEPQRASIWKTPASFDLRHGDNCIWNTCQNPRKDA